MARIVKKEDQEPMEVKVGGESKWICMCGLSKNQPFCDGSHKKVSFESEIQARTLAPKAAPAPTVPPAAASTHAGLARSLA